MEPGRTRYEPISEFVRGIASDGPGAERDGELLSRLTRGYRRIDDTERYVAAADLSAIDAEHAAEPEHLQRLAQATKDGAHHPNLGGPLVSVLAHHGPEDPLVREALLSLWERSTDPHERGRLYRMLGLARG